MSTLSRKHYTIPSNEFLMNPYAKARVLFHKFISIIMNYPEPTTTYFFDNQGQVSNHPQLSRQLILNFN